MDAKSVARGLVDGISSVPSGMHDGVIRTWQGSGLAGGQLKDRNQRETERFFKVVKSLGNKEEPLRRLITIVMTDFYEKLDDKGQDAVNKKLNYGAGRLAGKTAAQFVVAHTAANLMLRKSMSTYAWKKFVRYGTSFSLNMLMTQGLIEEAAKGSRRMRRDYPRTYYKIADENLDMVYFLVEPALEPYLKYINSSPMICKAVQYELCKILAK